MALPLKMPLRIAALHHALLPGAIGFVIGILSAIMGRGLRRPSSCAASSLRHARPWWCRDLLSNHFVAANVTFLQCAEQTVDFILVSALTAGGVIGGADSAGRSGHAPGRASARPPRHPHPGVAIRLSYAARATPPTSMARLASPDS